MAWRVLSDELFLLVLFFLAAQKEKNIMIMGLRFLTAPSLGLVLSVRLSSRRSLVEAKRRG